MYGGCAARCGLEVKIQLPLEPAWKFATGGRVRSSPVISGGLVYFGSDAGRIFAVDLKTGKEKWKVETGSPVRCAPAVAGGIVICGAEDGVLRALDAKTGKKKWRFRTGGPVEASPAVEGNRVVFGSRDGHAAPAVAAGRVYAGAWDWKIHALDLGTGKPLEDFGKKLSRERQKRFANRNSNWYLSPTRLGRVEGVAVHRGAVAVCASGDESYGQSLMLDPDSGDLLALSGRYMHKEIMDSNGWVFGAPAFSGGKMFIPYAWKPAGVLDLEARECLPAKSGQPGPVLNTPLVAGDVILAATKAGRLEAWSVWNGDAKTPARKLWEGSSPSGKKFATAPAAAGGHVVVGSDDGNVYAFSCTKGKTDR
jgi:outer membrane protein assembly factor BamB